ncbi:TIGR01458 family HAD-type hydrolase [Persephonella sp.]
MDFKEIKGLLLDIDGVLYVGDEPIKGSQETLNKLREKYKVMFITNTTTKPKSKVYKKLINMGFHLKEDEIFSALEATKQYLREKKGGVFPLLTDESMVEFREFIYEPVKYVVIGDARDNFNYKNLNKAFRFIINGAEIIAAAKNKYFRDKDQVLSLDCGPFVNALEYATGKKAVIVGKPSENFFNLAVSKMKLNKEEVAVVGDDIEADVKGAIDAGLKGILVKTGKFIPSDLEKDIKPDLVVDSINDLLEYI